MFPCLRCFPSRPALVAASAASAAIYVSSLVDWFIILPRISGQLGVRPCRSRSPYFAVAPRTWKETTRWWYIHRIATTLTVRAALALIAANVVGEAANLGLGGKGIVAAVTALAAVYISALPSAIRQAFDPQRVVSEVIEVGRIEPPRLRLPWREAAIPVYRGRFYIQDVDIAGLQLVDLSTHELADEGEEAEIEFPRHPTELALARIAATTEASPATSCAGRCGKANWYCVENPLAFRPK